MDFSFIIVNFKTKKLTVGCLDSIIKNCRGDFEIIVVDNNSGDGSVDFLQERFGAKIKIIANRENLGFGRANNQAAKIARGRRLFFLNSDALVEENIIPPLKVCFGDLRVGIAAPKLILRDGSPQKYASGKFPGFFQLLIGKVRQKDRTSEFDWVSGAALAIGKELFEKVGGFDENYFMYFEDIDLCWRVKAEGYGIVLADNARIIHFGGKSLGKKQERKGFYYQSQDYFYRQHYGLAATLFLRFLRFFYKFLKGG